MHDPKQQPSGDPNSTPSDDQTSQSPDTTDVGLDRDMDQIDLDAAREIGSDPPGSLGLGFDPDVDDDQSSAG